MSITNDYFQWQAASLDAAYKGSVIKEHDVDTGENREVILKKWLEKHLPKIVTPEIGGKIIDVEENSSKQIDIVIYDNRLPRFGAFDKPYFFAEGAVTAISVKSKLNSSTLSDSLSNLASCSKCKMDGASRGSLFAGTVKKKIPTGIFAYESDYASPDNLLKSLIDYNQKGMTEVDFVCVNKFCYIVYNRGTWSDYDDSGKKTPMKEGYDVVTVGSDCIWRLIDGLSTEANAILMTQYDFQPYFIKIPKQGTISAPSVSSSVSPSASPSPSLSPSEIDDNAKNTS